MSYIAGNPSQYAGIAVGSGQCVALVEQACGAPHTAQWKRGAPVRGNTALLCGTAIATFDPDGTYGNHTDGRSHAAIYIAQDGAGLYVWDQWIGQPVHLRIIHYRGGGPEAGKASNNGDRFSVIE